MMDDLSETSMSLPPLVIDLDGTLLQSDLLVESTLVFIRHQPIRALAPLNWLRRGKAHLKEKLAEVAQIDVSTLPYNTEIIALIKAERAKGRTIVLATASHKFYAEQVAAHLQLFDQVLATEQRSNLSATHKRDKLLELYGDKGFDYIGNSYDDLPVWACARHAYIVNPSPRLAAKAKALGNLAQILSGSKRSLRTWIKGLRFYQWIKNLLLFIPLLASHEFTLTPLFFQASLAFICFGLCASSVYLLNDLLDVGDDRQHPRKRYRPFASGQLAIKAGIAMAPILLLTAFCLALLFLPSTFAITLGSYYLLTLAYSLSLKRLILIDVITLAFLYTLRIIAGAFACALPLTFWMLAFSMFMFLSLALVKRYTELKEARGKGSTEKALGRGYYPDDLEIIASLGAASGYLSVMVLAFYIQEQTTIALYKHPQIIWLACPLLLFWISRTWLLAHRGQIHDDPVVFAIKDRISLIIGALFTLIFWIAT